MMKSFSILVLLGVPARMEDRILAGKDAQEP
jgi:hypothetical protein